MKMMNDEMVYYLIYYNDNSDNSNLYAYTSEKDSCKEFLKFRNKSFIMKKKELDYNERRFLCTQHSSSRIKPYKFNLRNKELEVYLTYQEILYLEAVITKTDISLTSLATINPMIFKPKITWALEVVRYNDFFLKYIKGLDVPLENEKFMLFIKEYSCTLNMDAIVKGVIP